MVVWIVNWNVTDLLLYFGLQSAKELVVNIQSSLLHFIFRIRYVFKDRKK